jgi:hypothetical protein
MKRSRRSQAVSFDHLLALESHRAEQERRPFVARDAFAAILASGIVPAAIIEDEVAEAASGR